MATFLHSLATKPCSSSANSCSLQERVGEEERDFTERRSLCAYLGEEKERRERGREGGREEGGGKEGGKENEVEQGSCSHLKREL